MRRWGKILSKHPLMSSSSMEAFMPDFCVARILCFRKRTELTVEILERELH
jgi:hypothetical protein